MELASALMGFKKPKNNNQAILDALTDQLQNCNSLNEIYDVTLRTIHQLPKSPVSAVFSVNELATHMRFKKQVGVDQAIVEHFDRAYQDIPINPKFTGMALYTKNLVYSPDVMSEERLLNSFAVKLAVLGIKSLALLPIIAGNNKHSVVALAFTETDPLDKKYQKDIGLIGKKVAQAISALDQTHN
jgi:GAF domain-containing protein